MPSRLAIDPVRRPLAATIRPPGSKSLTNRALVCAALASGTSTLSGVLASDDTQVMIDALRGLDFEIEAGSEPSTLRVKGCEGKISGSPPRNLYVGNSGTTVRFLTALVSLGHGEFRLHGTPRMHQRPIQDQLDALFAAGVDAQSEAGNGCPPVVVRGKGFAYHAITIRGDVSSQFASALLLVAPCTQGSLGTPALIRIEGQLVSRPYVAMTVAVMRAFGADVTHDQALSRFEVARTGYVPCDYAIEPDASAASYFWAAAAIAGGRVAVEGLTAESLQGDVGFCRCLERMGCQVRYEAQGITVEGGPLTGIDADMNAISDTAQTLAVVALFAKGPTTIYGIAHVRHKETDRIAALATELRKLGATVDERADGLRIVPGRLHGALIATYDDHRMAMSFALAGLKIAGVTIEDPGCTAKTYPGFWQDLDGIRS